MSGCSGSDGIFNWEQSDDGPDCYSYNGNTDIYSLAINNVHGGCNIDVVLFPDSFSCSGSQIPKNLVGNSCVANGGHSFKSFTVSEVCG